MDVRLPKLGEGDDSGSVVSVFVKEGDKVKSGQTLIELENEKAVAPVPSPASGTVSKVHVKVGDKLSVGQVILSLAGEAGETAPRSAEKTARPAPHAPVSGADDFVYQSKSGFPPPASPSVRKVAADLGIDLARVRGSERGGRVTIEDLKAYVRFLQTRARGAPPRGGEPAPEPAAEIPDFSKWGPVRKKPRSSLRRTIGDRMRDAWTTVPHVTQFDEADITLLDRLCRKHAPAYESKGVRLTVTSFVIKAVVRALKKYPVFNSSLDETTDEVVTKDYCHIGVAVDTESGLIVPVLRDADKKSLFDISKELADIADRTRKRKVSLEELKGSTFTISNLGGIGGSYFTPIVNAPEVGILGIGRSAEKPVAREGKSEIRLMMPLSLSYDHRVVDGADGARFIREVAGALETFTEEETKL